MPFKQSPREKMLRRLAKTVKECRDFNKGLAASSDHAAIHGDFQRELDFLADEIRKCRRPVWGEPGVRSL